MLSFVLGFVFLCVHLGITTAAAQSSAVCWNTVKVPRSRGKLEPVPTQERYLDYDCYLRTYHAYDCYKTRTSYRYDYVTEDYFVEEQVKSCCEGYRQSDGVCVPVCEKECVFGSCDSPNQCECSPGYEVMDPAEPNICEPHCDRCVNGVCSHPNVCDCLDGYKSDGNNENVCVPACTPPCVNGQCVQPNVCKCLSGYERRNETECAPVCTQPCQGTCTAPEVCTCSEDYHQLNNTHCQPRCDPPCNNGVCVAPQTCACLEHYEKVDNFTCRPTCDTPCINSHCTDVNQCSCNPGYVQVNASHCSPVCSSPCINGECVSPDRCYCSAGYQYVNGSYCEPYCENCQHGTCTAPHVCECERGFVISNLTGLCERICDEVCTNGTCINNKCFCQEGDMNPFCIIPCHDNYSLNPRTHLCEPHCHNCTRGYCLEPNVCRCPYNYHLEENTCVVNAKFYVAYIVLLDLYSRQDLFLSCKSELARPGPVHSVDIATWSLDTYQIISCNFEPTFIGNRSCEVKCDLALEDTSTGGSIVTVKCSLFNDRKQSVNYGSIECSATSTVQADPSSTSTSPTSTGSHSTSLVPLSSTKSSPSTTLDPLSFTTTQEPTITSTLQLEEKVLYECLNTTIDPGTTSDKVTTVFLRYFVDKRLVDQATTNQLNETINRNQSESLNKTTYHNTSAGNLVRNSQVWNRVRVGVKDGVQNKEMRTTCPVLCPAEHLTTILVLMDGTRLLAPVASCFERNDNITASYSTRSLVPVASYFCAAVLCVLLVALAVRYWMASRNVFFVKGRSCGDGAVEEETDEVFRLAGSFSEIHAT